MLFMIELFVIVKRFGFYRKNIIKAMLTCDDVSFEL